MDAIQIPIFSFGKYRNRPFDEVLDEDPGYIKWAYETVAQHAGIPRATYVAACDAIEDQDPGDDDYEGWDPNDFGF